MKLSTRGRYGMRAMVDLALHQDNGSVQLKEVAKRQRVSLKYLEQLVTPLRAAGLLRGVRGARGGYMLSRPPEEISLHDILQALEGSLAPVDCATDDGICNTSCKCATHELWTDLFNAINHILINRSLKDLAIRQVELDRCKEDALVYHI